MRKILTYYQVDPEFLPVLFSFGDGPHVAEGSSSNLSIQPTAGSDRSQSSRCVIRSLSGPLLTTEVEIAYQIRHVEENRRPGRDPWSLRHTGVYHHHTTDFDLWILLQPVEDSVIEKRLLDLQTLATRTAAELEKIKLDLERICTTPFRLHALIFNSYLDNWRWYFRHLGDRFEKEVSSTLTCVDAKHVLTVVGAQNDRALSLDRRSPTTSSLSFKLVQSLRNSHDTILSSRACCSGDLDVLQGLTKHCQSEFKDISSIPAMEGRLKGYVDSLDVLQGRIRNTIDLVRRLCISCMADSSGGVLAKR